MTSKRILELEVCPTQLWCLSMHWYYIFPQCCHLSFHCCNLSLPSVVISLPINAVSLQLYHLFSRCCISHSNIVFTLPSLVSPSQIFSSLSPVLVCFSSGVISLPGVVIYLSSFVNSLPSFYVSLFSCVILLSKFGESFSNVVKNPP